MSDGGRDLSREQLIDLLTEVGQLLLDQDTEAAIYVVGGAAMAISYQSRRVTRDVDATLRAGGEAFWTAVDTVASRHGLGPDWINNHATPFMTSGPDCDAAELTLPGLRIVVASAEHLIAMKLRAMRPRDISDLELLFRQAGITSPQQAADIHNRLFDDSYIGYFDPDEALYAATTVFQKAAAEGRPIGPVSS